MIISVSGKIGKGKDTVGLIIQYLTSPKGFGGIDVLTFIKQYEGKVVSCDWEIKKFADKLKDIVCMLIGCTREQLEDREFKEAFLGPEWDKWGFRTYINNEEVGKIGDNGLYLSEKEVIEAERNMRISMSWSRTLESRFEKVRMTPRLMLQLLGTEAGRGILHQNIWVNSLMADYNSQKSNWVITDTRFPNEAEAVLWRGGLLIRVNRPCFKCGGSGYHKMDCRPPSEHLSETGLDKYKKWSYVIDNNGSLEDLVKKVKKILVKERIV